MPVNRRLRLRNARRQRRQAGRVILWWCALTILVLFGIGTGIVRVQHDQQHANAFHATRAEKQKPELTDEERKASTDEALAFYTLWLMIFTGALAVSTVGLWVVTWRGAISQSRDMKESIRHAEAAANASSDQVRLSRAALIETERAFVFQSNIITKSHVNDNGETWWSFEVEWENSGNTPTRNLHLWAYPYIEADPLPRDFKFDKTVDTSHPIPSIIGPRGKILGSRIDVTGADLDRVKDGQLVFHLWGWAEYNDVFERTRRHVTRFCLMVIPLGDPTKPWNNDTNFVEFNYPQHPRFNCADDECAEQDRNPIQVTMSWIRTT